MGAGQRERGCAVSTETDFFIAEFDANIRAELVESLVRIDALKAQKRELEADLAELTDRVKAWLEAHPGEVLVDLERGITAELKERNKPAEIDLISAAQKTENDAHIVRAAGMGLLTARLTPLRQQAGKVECADVLLKYAMPGGVTHELRVERQR